MENTSDALIMAGQVLIFIIALTVCISSFSTAKTGLDGVISRTDTVKYVKGENGYINYIQSSENGAIRKVGVETIISSMYRAIKENYVIYIKLKNSDNIFTPHNDVVVDKYIAKNELVINNKKVIRNGDSLIKVTIGNDTNQQVNTILRNSLYNQLHNLSFYEYFGEYKDAGEANIEDKTTHRIITYIDTQLLTI